MSSETRFWINVTSCSLLKPCKADVLEGGFLCSNPIYTFLVKFTGKKNERNTLFEVKFRVCKKNVHCTKILWLYTIQE